MSQFFRDRPVLKVFAALGACCVPLVWTASSMGPSFGRLIDFKRKEESEQLLRTNTYDLSLWKIKLLDKYKHEDRSPIPFYTGRIEDNFLKEIKDAEGNTPTGFESEFKLGKTKNITASPDFKDEEPPKVDDDTKKPTSQQRIVDTDADDDRQGRNFKAKGVTDSVETPSKKTNAEDTSAHEAGEAITAADENKDEKKEDSKVEKKEDDEKKD